MTSQTQPQFSPPGPGLAPGEQDLNTLLSTLTTTLHPTTYVFITLPPATPLPPNIPLSQIQMLFHEPAEGATLILPRETAVASNLPYVFPCRMITLNVHSSLEAVGFMAVVATALARGLGEGGADAEGRPGGLGVNPVSGFYHDHLFVPEGREGEAVRILEELAREAREGRVVL